MSEVKKIVKEAGKDVVKGTIKNFRLGARTQKQNQFVIVCEGYDKKKASGLVGKKAIWTTESGKGIIGKVLGPHGDKGAIKVRFGKGLPGQAIGTQIIIK